MQMKRFITTVLLILIASSLRSQNVLEKLQGKWISNGSAFGMPARILMTWDAALENKFKALHYRIEMKASDGTLKVFEGSAFYKMTSDSVTVATWADSGGEILPIKAQLLTAELISVWGTPETKVGRTSYRFLGLSDLEVSDYIKLKDGSWKLFNRNKFERVNP
jgi:hypothetical protein